MKVLLGVYLFGMLMMALFIPACIDLGEYPIVSSVVASILVSLFWPIFLLVAIYAAYKRGGSK